jgi:tetratricopeptide (TPR) repeat protein
MSQQKIRLAHVYIEQADVARQQSNLPGAIEAYTKAIEIYKGMASSEPGCWALVADTIERAAATYKAAGDLDNAAGALKEAEQIRLALAKSEEAPSEEE